MIRSWVIVVIAGALACSCTSPQVATPVALVAEDERPDVPPRLAEAEAALREHVRVTQLGLVPDDAVYEDDILRGLLRWKQQRHEMAAAPFEAALTRNADPDDAEFALLRLAVLELNYGCEMQRLPLPDDLGEEQRSIMRDMLNASAYQGLMVARGYLEDGAAHGGRRNTLVRKLRDSLPAEVEDVAASCRRTSEAWRSPDTATLDQVADAGCDDREGAMCWVFAKWGSGGEEALEAACALEIGRACLELADRQVVFRRPQSDPSTAADAEQLYARACALGSDEGCRRQLALFIPARKEQYRSGCLDEDDAVACLKLARTLALGDDTRDLWWSCTTSDGRPAASEVAAKCGAGDAFACATRAGSLRVDPRYVIAIETAAADDPPKAALRCSEDDEQACAAGARAFAVAGDWGCAVALMIEACSRGVTAQCGFAEVR